MFKTSSLSAAALACTLLISGCASVGPDFQRPPADSTVPAQFARQEAGLGEDRSTLTSTDVREADFWRQFGDAQLTRLVQQALQGNHDVRAAIARLESAQALLVHSQMDRLPTVKMAGDATQQKLSIDQLSPGQARSTRAYSAGIAANWEVDWVGRVKRAIEVQQAEVQASHADVAALQVLIAAQVADTYTQLRGAQWRLRIAQAADQNQRDTLQLVERRFAAGSGTALDVTRARAQLNSTQARIPPWHLQVATLEHRLAVLLGLSPGALIAQLESPGALPKVPASLTPGTPAELLRRRPDLAAAEARLHAATARIGVVTADLFPRVSLGGVLGSFTLAGGDLFTGSSANHRAFLGIDWSFLDVGRVRARIAASEAGAAQALAQYQQGVLLALEEAENALIQTQRTRQEWVMWGATSVQRDEAEALAQRMYRGGTLSLYEVLDAQREQLIAQEAQAQSQVNAVRSNIALYKALAGGWPRPSDS
ncbi:efflux transporter outer membrane subunit [Ottowia thiooxydans]|uniref:Multidrug efflux system outer membrane protein n=1 Tax=Ottowia thiooxydans TaxID=219182 RepID=A0ABV2QG88_9BURK